MLALYRCGRQAEALEVFQGFRRTLSQELGLEPGPGLQQLELAILTRDPALDLPGATLAPEPERRLAGTIRPDCAASATIGSPPAAGARVGALALVARSAVVASSGGRAPPAVIPGDAVGAISASGGAIRAVVPLGTSPSSLAGRRWVGLGGERQRGDAVAHRSRHARRGRDASRSARAQAGSRWAPARCG